MRVQPRISCMQSKFSETERLSKMPAVAAPPAAAAAATQTSLRSLNRHSSLLAPSVIAPVSAFRHKDVIADRCAKMVWTSKPLPSSPLVVRRSNWPAQSELVMFLDPKAANSSKEKQFSHLSTASTALFGDHQLDGQPFGIPRLPNRRRPLKIPRASKGSILRLPFPVLKEKPEWWWRTLACVPYLIALQMSDTGYFIQPFIERYECFENLVYFVPGAVSRLPTFFPMIYCYIGYVCIVKNKDMPHFFRFHLMMGMLLEIALQIVWYSSNFFPLIHYKGTYGMYYWAGVGLSFILVLLHCVRSALLGSYASVPVVSDAALVHTLFNIGSLQRPF